MPALGYSPRTPVRRTATSEPVAPIAQHHLGRLVPAQTIRRDGAEHTIMDVVQNKKIEVYSVAGWRQSADGSAAAECLISPLVVIAVEEVWHG